MTVQTLTPDKAINLPICAPGDFLDEALEILVQGKNSAVLVIENSNDLVGILTDDDIIRAVQARCEVGDSINREHVFDWMSTDPITTDIETNLEKALSLMTRHQIRHLVITKNDKPISIIGVSDVLTALHTKEKNHAQHLRGVIGAPVKDLSPALYL